MKVPDLKVDLSAIEIHRDHPRHECGYYLHSDPSNVLHSLLESMQNVPLDALDKIYRMFQGHRSIVAECSEDGTWNLTSMAALEAVGQFTISSESGHIPSVNAEYIPVRRGRRAVKTLTTWGRDYKELIISQCTEFTEIPAWIDHIRDQIPGYIHLGVDFIVFYNHQHNRRDCTNMIKLTEDALSTVLGVDDARNKKVTISEHESPDDDEHIHIKVRLLQRT